jgi:hypothetical protein
MASVYFAQVDFIGVVLLIEASPHGSGHLPEIPAKFFHPSLSIIP